MSEILDMIINDEEIRQIKKEWLEIDKNSWMPFNYDEYMGFEDYKEKLKVGLEKLKNGEEPYNYKDSPLYHKWDGLKKKK